MRPGGRSSPEATQEIDASDVLEVIQVAREERHSSPSLLRVGFDVDVELGRNDETCQIRLAARRKVLSRYVIGAVAVSCLILVASVVKREVGSSDAHASTGALPAPSPAARPLPSTPTASTAAIPPPPPAPISIPSPPAAASTSSDTTASTSGSIRFTAPAKAGWLWLDGKRLSGTSAIVSCGTHQVKVGYNAKHAVAVPCGGEVALSR
jgi:hypothetical protein